MNATYEYLVIPTTAPTCLHLPRDLSDAEAIIVACTGNPGWRDAAVYGLGTLAVVGLILFALMWGSGRVR
jgi:hypothetical protein